MVSSSSRRRGSFVAKPLSDCIRNGELHAGFFLRLRHGLRRVALDIGRAVCIFAAEHPAGVYRVHHFLLIGVDDGQRQAALNGLRQKYLRNKCSLRQTERNVGYAEHRFKPQFSANPRDGFKRLLYLILLRGNRQRQAVNCHIFPRNARFKRRVQNRARKAHARLAGRWQSVFAQRKSDDRSAVFFCNREHRFQRRAGCVYAVDHALSGAARRPASIAFGLEESICSGRLTAPLIAVTTRRMVSGSSISGSPHVDIQNLCAGFGLFNRLRNDIIHVAFAERLLKTLLSVGLIRSPITRTPCPNGQISPAEQIPARSFSSHRAVFPSSARPSASMNAGVVPQQPPIYAAPTSVSAAQSRANSSGAV